MYGYSYSGQSSPVERLKLVVDVVNRESPLSDLYHSVSSIMFGQNIVILRKQTQGEQHYFNKGHKTSHLVLK